MGAFLNGGGENLVITKACEKRLFFPEEKSPLRDLNVQATYHHNIDLSTVQLPFSCRAFSFSVYSYPFMDSSLFFSLSSPLPFIRLEHKGNEERDSSLKSISLWSPKKSDVGSHLRLLLQAVGRDQQLGTEYDGLALCTNKRGPSHTKCLLKTCDRTTQIPKFTVGNSR